MRAAVFILVLAFAGVAEARDLAALSWLQGCWRYDDARGTFTEVWATPPMPALVGYNIRVAEGATEAWSQMRIESRNDDYVLLAMPNGYGPVTYTWSEYTPGRGGVRGRIAFDTADRRYPQRVIYERDGDRMTATIVNWRGREEVTNFQRVDCATIAVR